MNLSIRGGTAFHKHLARSSIEFAKTQLMPRHRTLDITVKIRKFGKEEGSVIGWCTYEDSEVKPREFTIEISQDIPFEAFIKTIFHEMVHVKQFAKSELRDRHIRGNQRTIWKGTNHTNTAYTKAPWEKEAYRLQESLYKKYMNNPI